MTRHLPDSNKVIEFLYGILEPVARLGRLSQAGGRLSTAERLQLLEDEYKRAREQTSQEYAIIFQSITIGYTAFSALIAYVFIQHPHIEVVYWLAPFAFVILYCLILLSLFQNNFSQYYLRRLEDELHTLSGFGFLHLENATASGIFSPRTGLASARLIYMLLIGALTALYISFVAIGFWRLHTAPISAPAWRLELYVPLHSLVAIALIWALASTQSKLRQVFLHHITQRFDDSLADRTTPPPSLLGFLILPKAPDFLIKVVVTLGASAITMLFTRTSLTWRVAGYVIVTVVIVDLLAKQTTYVLNDLRNYESDRHDLSKRIRYLARTGNISGGKFVFYIRLILTVYFTLAVVFALSVPWLFVIVLLIFTIQLLYEYAGKRHAPVRLSIAAVGYSERAAAGCLAVISLGQANNSMIVLISAWAVVYATMFLSAVWRSDPRVEAHEWYQELGMQVFVAAGGVLIALSLALVYQYSHADNVRNLVVLAPASILVYGLYVWLCFHLEPGNRSLIQVMLVILSIVVGIVAVWMNIEWKESSGLWLLLAADASIFAFVAFYRLTSEEKEAFEHLIMSIPSIPRSLDALLLSPIKYDMNNDLCSALQKYLDGKIGRRDLSAWIAGFDWDDTSADALALRPFIGQLELLTEEVGEGLRDEAELRSFAGETLDRMHGLAVRSE